MKFFTLELYHRFQSEDDRIADQADADWDKADEDYQKHLTTIKLPDGAIDLSHFSLHDWKLIGLKSRDHSISLFLKSEDDKQIAHLFYATIDDAYVTLPAVGVYWLYEELDEADSRRFSDAFIHRILWSDESVIEIPFRTAELQVIDL